MHSSTESMYASFTYIWCKLGHKPHCIDEPNSVVIAGLPDGEIDGLKSDTPYGLRRFVTRLAKLVEYIPFQLCRGRSDGSSVETYTTVSPVSEGLSLRKALGPALSMLSLNGGTVLSSLIVRRIPSVSIQHGL
jgi:hypothetical protein